MAENLEKPEIKHCKIKCILELAIGSGTTESAFKFDSALDQ